MKKILVSVATLALVTACSDNGADADGDGKITTEEMAAEMNEVELEAGEWENTVEITDIKLDGLPPGVPAGSEDMIKEQIQSQMTSTTTKSCMTEEQAKDPGAEIFAAQDQSNCEVSKFNMSGGAIDSEMSCKGPGGQGAMNMTMDGQYGPSSYDMNMAMNIDVMGMKVAVNAKNSGKRVGACPS